MPSRPPDPLLRHLVRRDLLSADVLQQIGATDPDAVIEQLITKGMLTPAQISWARADLAQATMDETVNSQQTRPASTEHSDARSGAGISSLPTKGLVRSGRILGSYRLGTRIGQGGQGAVYIATHEKLGKRFAVKVLERDATRDRDKLERLKREAIAIHELKHKNIVGFYDFGLTGETAWLAMEYVDGESVRRMVRRNRGAFDTNQVRRIVLQILSALEAAHAIGICHRDLSSNNVLIRKSDGAAMLVDFGLAKGELVGQSMTSNAIVGTLAYIPPEQFDNATADARGDLWALGVLIAELVTGRVPFDTTSQHRLIKSLCFREPDLSGIRAPDLLQLAQRCLVKDPAKRVQSAAEAAGLLLAPRSSRHRVRLLIAGVAISAAALVATTQDWLVRSTGAARSVAATISTDRLYADNELDELRSYFASKKKYEGSDVTEQLRLVGLHQAGNAALAKLTTLVNARQLDLTALERGLQPLPQEIPEFAKKGREALESIDRVRVDSTLTDRLALDQPHEDGYTPKAEALIEKARALFADRKFDAVFQDHRGRLATYRDAAERFRALQGLQSEKDDVDLDVIVDRYSACSEPFRAKAGQRVAEWLTRDALAAALDRKVLIARADHERLLKHRDYLDQLGARLGSLGGEIGSTIQSRNDDVTNRIAEIQADRERMRSRKALLASVERIVAAEPTVNLRELDRELSRCESDAHRDVDRLLDQLSEDKLERSLAKWPVLEETLAIEPIDDAVKLVNHLIEHIRDPALRTVLNRRVQRMAEEKAKIQTVAKLKIEIRAIRDNRAVPPGDIGPLRDELRNASRWNRINETFWADILASAEAARSAAESLHSIATQQELLPTAALWRKLIKQIQDAEPLECHSDLTRRLGEVRKALPARLLRLRPGHSVEGPRRALDVSAELTWVDDRARRFGVEEGAAALLEKLRAEQADAEILDRVLAMESQAEASAAADKLKLPIYQMRARQHLERLAEIQKNRVLAQSRKALLDNIEQIIAASPLVDLPNLNRELARCGDDTRQDVARLLDRLSADKLKKSLAQEPVLEETHTIQPIDNAAKVTASLLDHFRNPDQRKVLLQREQLLLSEKERIQRVAKLEEAILTIRDNDSVPDDNIETLRAELREATGWNRIKGTFWADILNSAEAARGADQTICETDAQGGLLPTTAQWRKLTTQVQDSALLECHPGLEQRQERLRLAMLGRLLRLRPGLSVTGTRPPNDVSTEITWVEEHARRFRLLDEVEELLEELRRERTEAETMRRILAMESQSEALTLARGLKLPAYQRRAMQQLKDVAPTAAALPADAWPPPSTWTVLEPARTGRYPRRIRHNETGIEFVLIPAGSFTMGHARADIGTSYATPVRIDIARPFYMAETEVTNRQLAPLQPRGWIDDVPAVNISHEDATRFCRLMGCELPWETQWEYACLANAAGFWNRRVENGASICGPSAMGLTIARPTDGDSFVNDFGLYHMHGNAMEWCRDAYDRDAYKERERTGNSDPRGTEPADDAGLCVVRGGAFKTPREKCTARHRRGMSRKSSEPFLGFRPVLEVPK